MIIKKLEGKARFDAYMTAVYCFHMRVEDTEAEREKYEADTKEDWGAFDEKGTLMGRILNHKYDLYLDGKTVRAGGIGAVATLPEYRDQGVIKEIFRELLPAAYKDGEQIGECDYRITEDGWTIYHTDVAPEHEGKGIAKRLVYKLTEAAEKKGANIIPVCSYAVKVLSGK